HVDSPIIVPKKIGNGFKINAVAGDQDAPDVGGGGFFFIQEGQQGNVIHFAVFIRGQVAQFTDPADVDGPVFIYGQGAGHGKIGKSYQSPVIPVEFQDAVNVTEVHNAPVILDYGPILAVGVIFFGRIIADKRAACFGKYM
ncbi:MAG: hypothetical protein QG657_1035, partial [Acidobacteriota bacterium]|nr:hypothetical protein [Acidobacteriota bacterium]